MILSNEGIQSALDAGDLAITPEPAPRRPSAGQRSCPYDTCSVNLRLGPQLSIPKPGRPSCSGGSISGSSAGRTPLHGSLRKHMS